jgi:hypothetical protein
VTIPARMRSHKSVVNRFLTMASKSDIQKELDFVTGQLSTQVRTLALGTLAFTWGLFVSNSPFARALTARLNWQLVLVSIIAVLTMSFDFLQYLMGYINVDTLFNRVEADGETQGHYDYDSLSWKVRKWCFRGKIVALIVAVLWLVCILAYWLFSSYSTPTPLEWNV